MTCYLIILIILSGCSNPYSYEDRLNTRWMTPGRLETVYTSMEYEASLLHDIGDVRRLQSKFRDRNEKRQWTSTIETIFYYDFTGDCEDAVVLGIWSLNIIGISAREVLLQGDDKDLYHSIAMSDDNSIFITNSYVIKISSDNWKEIVLKFGLFKGKYNTVID